MPPAITGPAESSEPPLPGTPLAVWKSRAVSKSQRIAPVLAEKARKWPSIEPEKTAPGMAEMAADWALLQPFAPGVQCSSGGGVLQILRPVRRSTADRKSVV